MKINILWITLLASMPLFADTMSAEALFDTNCAICHMKEKPTPQTRANMVAPPAMGVMFNLKAAFKNDKAATLAFMRDYVIEPSAQKAKCLPQAVKRFGIMPSVKGTLTSEQLKIVTEYMYDTFPPKGFEHKHQQGMMK
jgi:mono/diheme cytochrome c family protein